jgi:hypothetical protein
MLRTNLSTRPFYNIRAVQVTLAVLALVVVAMTIFNVVQVIRLMASERALGARAAQAEARANQLREEARQVRSRINTRELADVAAAAEEANALIDLRTFSWSQLFAALEQALPESVRFTSFQPAEDREGRFVVSARVQARRVQDLESYLDELEKSGVFHDVLATEEQTDPEGLINAVVEGVYTPPARDQQPAGVARAGATEGAAGE